MAEFSHPTLVGWGGKPLECRDEIWRQKTRIVELPNGEKIMMFRHNTGSWQTDGQTRYDRYYPS